MWLWRLSPKIYRQQDGDPQSPWHSSSLKASRLKTQEDSMSQLKPKVKKRSMSMLNSHRAGTAFYSALLFYSALHWMGPLTLGRAIFLTRSVSWNVNLIQKHTKHTQTYQNIWPNVSSSWPSQDDTYNSPEQEGNFSGLLCLCPQIRRKGMFEVMSPGSTWLSYYFYRNSLIHTNENN